MQRERAEASREETALLQSTVLLLLGGAAAGPVPPATVAELKLLAEKGRQDAEVLLVGLMRSADQMAAMGASGALKAMWALYPSPKAGSLAEQGARLRQAGKFEEAVVLYDAMTLEFTRWCEPFRWRAACRSKTGDSVGAIEDLRRAAQRSPLNYQIMVELAFVLMGAGHYEESLASFERAGRICPSIPLLDLFIGQLLEKAPHLSASTGSVVAPEEPPPELLPAAWEEACDVADNSAGASMVWGAALLHRLLEVVETAAPGVESPMQALLLSLASEWNPRGLPPAMAPLASRAYALTQLILEALGQETRRFENEARWSAAKASFQEVRRHTASPGGGDVAGRLVSEGWAHVAQVGVHADILAAVRAELESLEPELMPGGDIERITKYRNDRALFFDSDPAKMRRDLPGLHELDDVLQAYVHEVSAATQGRVALTSREKPMLGCYDSGGFYKRHTDGNGHNGRVLTAVYYLNRDWAREDGGAIHLYPGVSADEFDSARGAIDPERCVKVWPEEDSLVIFMADHMLHEVCPHTAQRKRFALTQWYHGTSL